MTRKPFARDAADAVAGKPKTRAKIAFVEALNRHLPPDRRAILVGGSLVEFYTTGQVTSVDIDLIGPRKQIVPLLEAAGFSKHGRTWWNPDLDLVVDVAGSSVGPSERVVMISDGPHRVPAVTLEDALVDRLNAAKHWNSYQDWERSVILWDANRSRFDMMRLRARAEEEGVDDYLTRLESL